MPIVPPHRASAGIREAKTRLSSWRLVTLPASEFFRLWFSHITPCWQCNAEVPDALSEIIDRLLEKKPEARFASADDLEKALASVLADVQQGRIGRRQIRSRGRHRWLWVPGALVTAAFVVTVRPYLRWPTPSGHGKLNFLGARRYHNP